MRVFTNNKFTGHWPVGTAAVVMADTPEEAAAALEAELARRHLPQTVDPMDMMGENTEVGAVVILADGNY